MNSWVKSKEEFEKTGVWSGIKHPTVLARKYRRYFLETKEYKCVICNNSQWNNQPIPLVLDHVDGKSDNWELTNLRLICCNCDAQLPTYKNKNKGNGRGFRRERYADGKTF